MVPIVVSLYIEILLVYVDYKHSDYQPNWRLIKSRHSRGRNSVRVTIASNKTSVRSVTRSSTREIRLWESRAFHDVRYVVTVGATTRLYSRLISIISILRRKCARTVPNVTWRHCVHALLCLLPIIIESCPRSRARTGWESTRVRVLKYERGLRLRRRVQPSRRSQYYLPRDRTID